MVGESHEIRGHRLPKKPPPLGAARRSTLLGGWVRAVPRPGVGTRLRALRRCPALFSLSSLLLDGFSSSSLGPDGSCSKLLHPHRRTGIIDGKGNRKKRNIGHTPLATWRPRSQPAARMSFQRFLDLMTRLRDAPTRPPTILSASTPRTPPLRSSPPWPDHLVAGVARTTG